MMVVDKDVEGLGEWILGEVKNRVGRYTYCTALQMEGFKAKGTSARLVNFLCTGRILIGAGLDVVCWSIWTPRWPPCAGSETTFSQACMCKAAVPVRRKTCERCDLIFRFKRKAECNLREKTL